MMLVTLDSMIQNGRIQYDDIMEKFGTWLLYGDYTPYGETFDVGITCAKAISKYRPGVMEPTECGGNGERDNGNGSLMRIMPVSLYDALDEDYWHEPMLEEAAIWCLLNTDTYVDCVLKAVKIDVSSERALW